MLGGKFFVFALFRDKARQRQVFVTDAVTALQVIARLVRGDHARTESVTAFRRDVLRTFMYTQEVTHAMTRSVSVALPFFP